MASVLPASGKLAQEITVPLFRDFARIRVYLASAPRYGQVTYNYQRISFLNFPVLMSPSFRENDSEKTQLAASTPGTGKAMEHTGTYSYGVKNEGAQLTVYEAPLTAEGEIDYVAMDIKNVPGKYQETTGLAEEGAYAEASDNAFPVKAVQQSVELLKKSGIPYEFRTTVVKEFHTQQVLQEICIWIAGSPAYYLQQFEDSGQLIAKMEGSVDKGMIFHAYEEAEIKRIAEHLNHIPGMEGKVHLRGMNGK